MSWGMGGGGEVRCVWGWGGGGKVGGGRCGGGLIGSMMG